MSTSIPQTGSVALATAIVAYSCVINLAVLGKRSQLHSRARSPRERRRRATGGSSLAEALPYGDGPRGASVGSRLGVVHEL